MKRTLHLPGLLLLTALAGACGSAMVGLDAPALPTENWISPGARPAAVVANEQWMIIEFFSPT